MADAEDGAGVGDEFDDEEFCPNNEQMDYKQLKANHEAVCWWEVFGLSLFIKLKFNYYLSGWSMYNGT